MGINHVAISGNLTRDPEMRSTASGMAVLGFGVAVNDRRQNRQTGEWEDYANFIDVTMFGKRAEAVQRYLSKGAKVAIGGKLRYSSWEKDGQRRSKVEVIAEDIELMSRQGAPEGQGGPQGYQGQPQGQGGAYGGPQGPHGYQGQPQGAQMRMPQGGPAAYDEDIPF